MTKEIDNGGPAFPQPCKDDGFAANGPYGFAGGGLSAREWFAGMALQGILASGCETAIEKLTIMAGGSETEGVSMAAYGFADAMLTKRTKQIKKPQLIAWLEAEIKFVEDQIKAEGDNPDFCTYARAWRSAIEYLKEKIERQLND